MSMSRNELSPKPLYAGEFLQGLAAAARDNPVPAALLGAGALWLLGRDIVALANLPRADATERAVKVTRTEPRSLATDPGEDTASRPRTISQEVVKGAHVARQGMIDLWDEQPLVVGAVGLAIGAALASVFPTTTVEADVLGPQTEQLVAQTRSFVTRKVAEARDLTRAAAAE